MHEKVLRLKTHEDGESFGKNVEEKYPDVAREARRRAVPLKAAAYGAEKESEREALQAVYAAEAALSAKNGKKTRASRTWQSIARCGLLQTVERVVCNRKETDAYNALVDMDIADFTFESVVARHPGDFSAETVARAQKRLAEQQGGAKNA
jgi:hypothetical protein